MRRKLALVMSFAVCALAAVGTGLVQGEECNGEYGIKEFCKTYESDWKTGGEDVTGCGQVVYTPSKDDRYIPPANGTKSRCNGTKFIVSEFLVLSCGKGDKKTYCAPVKNADGTYMKTKCATYTTCKWNGVQSTCVTDTTKTNTTQYAANFEACTEKAGGGGGPE